MASLSELAKKRVFGVPVVYLVGGAVVILAVVAWKMPNSKGSDDAGDVASDPSAGGGLSGSDPYDSLNTNGTVTVVQQPQNTQPDDVIKTNEQWAREGAEWLTSQKGVSGSQGISALMKFLNGEDRSFDEENWVNLVIAEKGQPPEGVPIGGKVGDKPAQQQFSIPPGTHTVKGNSDNTYAKLATLYYGSSSGEVEDLIQNANPSLPLTQPFSVGTSVHIPKYTAARYWVVPARMDWKTAAGKNGISEQQLRNLNNGPAAWRNAPYLNKGQKIRVA